MSGPGSDVVLLLDMVDSVVMIRRRIYMVEPGR